MKIQQISTTDQFIKYDISNIFAEPEKDKQGGGTEENTNEEDAPTQEELDALDKIFETELIWEDITFGYEDEEDGEGDGDSKEFENNPDEDEEEENDSKNNNGQGNDEDNDEDNEQSYGPDEFGDDNEDLPDGSFGDSLGENTDDTTNENENNEQDSNEPEDNDSEENGDEPKDEDTDTDSNEGEESDSEENKETADEDNGADGDGEETDAGEANGDKEEEQVDGEENFDHLEEDDNDIPELTDAEIAQLEKALESQEEFMEGESQKSEVGDKKAKSIDALDDAGVAMETVGEGYEKSRWDDNKANIECIVVRNLTQQLIDADPFGVFGRYRTDQYDENVRNGIRLGTMLGRKLQIRNEERNTKYSRLHSGRIDKRLLSSLGYGAEQVFSQIQVDKFNPVYLHISVDASGSMGGEKWKKTMIAVVAICKAASMVNNLDVSVDFRMTTDRVTGNEQPLVIVAYDSRKDSFKKVSSLFKYIDCPGTTPEGLCFEAISKFIKEDKATDQYFINFSDGSPGFSTRGFYYSGSGAIEHTKKQVDNMRMKGIKILSYFVTRGGTGYGEEGFKRMYGKDAVDVNVTDLIPLAKSINKLFSEK